MRWVQDMVSCSLSVLAAWALVAHATPSSASGEDAVIVQPSAQSRAALRSAVGKLLYRDEVTLADDALTANSRLVIEPTLRRDSRGMRLQGRETRAPEVFRLVKDGARCILIHESTGERRELEQTQCAPTPGSAVRGR